MEWIGALVVIKIKLKGDADLFQIVDALCGLSFDFGGGQSRKEHGRKDCDNGNDDEKFDQRESGGGPSGCGASVECPAHKCSVKGLKTLRS